MGKRRAPKAVGRYRVRCRNGEREDLSTSADTSKRTPRAREENAHLGLFIVLGASLPPPPASLPHILSSRTGRLLPRGTSHRRGRKRAPSSANPTEDTSQDARRATEGRSSNPGTTSSSKVALLLGRRDDGRSEAASGEGGGGGGESTITLAGEGAERGEVEGVGLGATVDLAVGERG